MDVTLITLLDLLADDEHMAEVEQVVRRLGVTTPAVQLDPARVRAITAARGEAAEAFRLARTWYGDLIEAAFDSPAPHEELPGTRAFVAYLVAACAARVGRLPDARRWLHLGHWEAEADGLGAEEVALFIAAIRKARG